MSFYDESTVEQVSRERALLVECPVSWCGAPVGEPCYASPDEHDNTESPPHSPRRFLVPERSRR